MPDDPNKVHWYYALAEDKTGNWDRVPDPDSGNYAYFQTGFDVCAFTPKAPEPVSVTASGNSAVVTWCAPTEYEPVDGLVSSIRTDDVLTYEVDYLGGSILGGDRSFQSQVYPHESVPRYLHL